MQVAVEPETLPLNLTVLGVTVDLAGRNRAQPPEGMS